jgi:ADP-heptose:LPS heptosyltransferase
VGDSLIALSMLPEVARLFPEAALTAVCQEVVAPLYQACPHVAGVVAFDRRRALTEAPYQQALAARIKAVGADLVLHSVHSREPLGDFLALSAGAAEAVAFGGDPCNMPAERHRELDPLYSRLLPPEPPGSPELERHRAFLRALGGDPGPLGPRLWLRPEDEVEALALLAGLGVAEGEAIAVFPGSKAPARLFRRWGEVLRPFTAAGVPLLVVGSEEERAVGEELLQAAGGRGANLCRSLPLRVTGALLKRCRLAVGVETGLVQLATAVGLRSVVACGGSFFGRFLPSTALTSLAVLPLDCYRCDGRCIHDRPWCMTELAPAVVDRAIREALAGPAPRPRIYVQQGWQGPAAGPRQVAPVLPAGLAVELIEVPVAAAAPVTRAASVTAAASPAATAATAAGTAATAAAPGGGPSPRTTVFCAVWHKDSRRLERLRGHQACLDAQTVPVDRVYVFDGGDPPPDWVKGKVVTAREPLGLYEAWNVALPFVRTPYLMNLNLDDRLNPDAVARYQAVLDAGADLVGGDWRICFSQEETDAVEPCTASATVPFFPEWPPVPGRTVRLGSGTGQRGTYGPACAWRLALHAQLARYPWKFGDGSPVRVIGDAIWWGLLGKLNKRLERLPLIVGRYLSDPAGQAEFRNPGDDEHRKLGQHGIQLL